MEDGGLQLECAVPEGREGGEEREGGREGGREGRR